MLTSKIDAKRLETLIEINSLINSNYKDARSLLTRIIESATRLTMGEASSLLLVNRENNKLYFEISLGSKGSQLKNFSLNMGEGIAGWVAKNTTSLIVNDVDTDSRFYSEIGKKIQFETKSILAVPMLIKNQPVGVLEIINRTDGGYFNNEDLQWLEIFANQAALAIQNAREYQRIKDEVNHLQDEIHIGKGFHTFIGTSRIIKEKLELTSKIALTNSSVLITGESGVGKELFAEQIHLQSDRRDKPFVRVNCAALPANLLESELFGHVKGAYTDASSDRRGRFELADGGTIFLDEIGEIPISLQTKLLRVIQNKVFEKVGSSESILVDVRILAATNKDMEKALEEGTFRRDLYYRLNVLPFYVPPLRERQEDISELALYFLKKIKRETKKHLRGFSTLAIDALLTYSWPGNVRELENVVERAAVIANNEYIQPEDLMLQTDKKPEEYRGETLRNAVTQFKKHFIKNVLDSHGWKQTNAARELGIQRTYLSKLIKELNLRKQ